MKAVSCLRIAALFVVLFVQEQKVASQGYNYEAREKSIAIGVGWAYMFSDAAVASKSGSVLDELLVQDAGISVSVEYRNYVKPWIASVLNTSVFRFKGAKDFTRNPRAYQYLSHAGEGSALINFEVLSSVAGRRIPVDLYLIGGFGGIAALVSGQSFAPDSGRPDSSDKLQSLAAGISFIAGAGLRFPISRNMDVRLETKYHTGTSDYLDGYSPKASRYPDLIVEGSLKISWRLRDKSCNCF